jgi:hypothetical protein
MKTLGTRWQIALVASWTLAVVAVLGLSPCRVVAQDESGGEKFKNLDEEQAAPNEGAANPQATSGKFKITVDRVRRVDIRTPMSLDHTAFPMVGSKINQQSQSDSSTETTPEGHVLQKSAGGGGAGTGGGGGCAFLSPNLLLDLKVEGPKTGGKRKWICELNGKVRAIDDQGREASAPEFPSMLRYRLQGVDYHQGPGRTATHLNLPADAKSISSLDGQLHVAPAIVNEIAFQGSELAKKTEKRSGDIAAKLSKVAQSPEGIDVKLSIEPVKKPKQNTHPMQMQMPNPADMLKQFMKDSAGGRITVALVDSAGFTHAPKSTSNNASNSGSFQNSGPNGGGSGTFSSQSSGGSANGGGFGGGDRGSSGDVEKPLNQHNANKSPADKSDSTPGTTYHFDPLPEGVTVKSIQCTVIDLIGEPMPVPFHLENVPLP